MTLSESIKNARLQKNITQEDLAIELGVTQGYISQVESGERPLSAFNILKVERALGLETGTIWGIQNVLMDRIQKNIKSLNQVELSEVDEYLRFVIYKRNSESEF